MKVLFVDDEDIIVRTMSDLFEGQIDTCTTVCDAIQKLEKEKYSIVITDYALPDGGGARIANYCIAKNIPCVINSGYSREQMEGISRKLQIVDKMECVEFLVKFMSGGDE